MLLGALPICLFTGCAFIPQMLWVLAAHDSGLCPFMGNCPWPAGASSPAVVPETMAVSYVPHPGEGGGQRLSDERM